MKAQFALCLVVVGLCASWSAAQTCPASFFGSASAFNVFLLGGGSGNFTFDLIDGDVQGRVASNGNFRAINFGVGTGLGSCNSSTPTVIIGGQNSSVSFSGGLQCGSLVTENSADILSLPGFANGQLVQGSVSSITGVDFDAARTELDAQASSLCSAGGDAATVSGNAITLTGANDSSLAFTINVADINSASSLTLDVPDASIVEQVVVLLVGSADINIGGFQTFLNGVDSGLVTYVVCSAPSVTISDFGLEGNLLAPTSDVDVQNAQILGNVVALSLTGSGSGEVHIPTCPSPSPSASASPAASASASPAASASASPSVAASASPSSSASPSPSSSASPSPSSSASPSPSSSASPSTSPSTSPSASASPSQGASASPSPSISASPSASSSPSSSPSPSPSTSPSASASASPSSSPSASPLASPSPSGIFATSAPSPSASASASPVPSPSATPLCPAPLFGANVSAFNVFLFGSEGSNFAFDMTSGDVEGRVAVNGSFRAISFGIGTRISPCNSSLPTVVVAGDNATINFEGGLQCGTLVAENSDDLISLPGFANGRPVLGSVQNLTGINFTAEAEQINATANGLCAAGGVAATVSAFKEITLQGTTNATQAFTVNASDINVATSMLFNFPNASAVQSVVVTILGNESLTFTNFGINNGGVPSAYFTYVVCSSAHVTISGFGLEGNLLAFNSSVTLENGQIVGDVVARTLNGSGGGEVHVPTCPTPVPSPSASPSASPAASASGTPSATPSSSPSASPSPSSSSSASPSPSNSASPSPSSSASPSPSSSASPSPSNSASPSPSNSASPSPSNSASPSPSSSASPSPSSSASPSSSPSSSPSAAGSPSPTIVSTPQPSSAASPSPSASPSAAASASPSSSASPSAAASASPSPAASPSASASPVATPSAAPSCPPSFFGGASAYNVFLSGNPSKQFAFNMTNGDVEGKVAVDGSFFASSFGIGSTISCTSAAASQPTLIVSGSTVSGGAVDCGELVTPASTTVTGVSFNNGKAVTGDIASITGLDFASVESSLASASSSLCSATGVSATVGSGNRITFPGTSNATEQTFTLTTAQLSSASSIRFAFDDASAVGQVVINVVGNDAVDFSGFSIDLGGVSNGLITWNICSATSVTINSFDLQGNLLAPLADVFITNGQINGNVAARTLAGTGSGEVHTPTCP